MKKEFWILLIACGFSQSSLSAADFTGEINLRHVLQLDQSSGEEDPGLDFQLTADTRCGTWELHTVLTGAADGTVGNNGRDTSLVKNFTDIYQDNSPFVDLKEFYLEREAGGFDGRIGVQRLTWGRLDEYPVNDLLNPWEYNRVFSTSLADRKIGVPAVNIEKAGSDLTYQLVWEPWFIPYRLPEPGRRWSITPTNDLPADINGDISVSEPDLPARTRDNSTIGARLQSAGEIDWAFNFFHGIDPRPVFTTTDMIITENGDRYSIDPGYRPAFHTINVIGMDGATIIGDWSLRAEAAFTSGRTFNIRQELWGYPETFEPGTFPLNDVEVRRDTLDYGIAADYRLWEDWLLTLQAQQSEIFNRPDTLYDQERETLLWANLKIDRLVERLTINLNFAVNPEHGATMIRPTLTYTLSDNWKLGVAALLLDGPPPSIFGRYAANDQIETTLTYAW